MHKPHITYIYALMSIRFPNGNVRRNINVTEKHLKIIIIISIT